MSYRLSVLTVLLGLFVSLNLSAQSTDGSVSDGSPDSWSIPLTLGVYALAQVPLGAFADFVDGAAGGGIACEYLVATIPSLGVSARLEGAFVFPSIDEIDSYWTCSMLAGVFYRIGMKGNFSVQGELSAGMHTHKIDDSGSSSVSSSAYIDPALQSAVSFRWQSSAYSFELSPVYTALIEESGVLNLFGVRVGVLYSLK